MISIAKGPITRGILCASLVLGLRLVVQAGTLLLAARLLGPHAYAAFAGVVAFTVLLGALSTFAAHCLIFSHASRRLWFGYKCLYSSGLLCKRDSLIITDYST